MSQNDFLLEVQKLGINLNNTQQGLLQKYCNLLLKYNQKVNLTAFKTEEEVYLKHFYDSLTLNKIYQLNNESVLDIGTGAGFPGIVLKICFPHIKLTLLDSNHKKTDFLNYIISELNLLNVIVINDRDEKYYLNGCRYDLVVSRAVANLNVLSELAIPYCHIGGSFIAMKGKAADEIEEAKDIIQILGGEMVDIQNFILPKENSDRSLIKIKKIKETPNGYPRPYDKIIKKQLKNSKK